MKQSSKTRAWHHRHVHDFYVREAQAQGYRSRAAFKLMEIDDRDRLFRPGMAVVDLGAAPGGWCQVARERLKGQGRIIGLDLLEIAPIPGVEFIQGDFTEADVLQRLEASLAGRPVDLVICDMAPNISGVNAADQAKSYYLAELALDFAAAWLQPRGVFLVKVFQGEGFEAFMKAMRGRFSTVAVRKPKASRERSPEVYLLGREVIEAERNLD